MVCEAVSRFFSGVTCPECSRLKKFLEGRVAFVAFIVISLIALAIGVGLVLGSGGGFSLYNLAALFLVVLGTGGVLTAGLYCRKKQPINNQQIQVTFVPSTDKP